MYDSIDSIIIKAFIYQRQTDITSNVKSRKEFTLKLKLVFRSKLDSHFVYELRSGNSIQINTTIQSRPDLGFHKSCSSA